jgi:phosphate-selective porin OprO/OprP
MKPIRWMLGVALLALAGPLWPQEPAQDPQDVQQRLDELEQKIRILERKDELDKEAAAEKAKTGASAVAGRDGFSLRSADGNFQLKLRGYTHFDGRFFQGDDERPATDQFLLRRVRPIVEGTVYKIFDFRIMPDFAEGRTVLQDGYVEARFTPAFKLRAGKFKPPVGLERLQSATEILFVERAFPTSLVPNRDLGIQLSGDVANGTVSYALGVFNGVTDGGNGDGDINDSKDVAARLFFTPFAKSAGPLKNLGFGVAGSTGDQEGTLATPGLPSFRTPGQQTFFSYRADGTAAGTVLPGGEPTYKSVSPKKVFDREAHTYGAWEIAARYSELHVDEDAFPIFANPASAARSAKAWAVGLNWYLNKNLRWMLDYERTTFEGGAASGDRQDESILFNRIQVSF